MSGLRSLKLRSGQLIWTPLIGFWQAPKTLDAADPQIPNLPLLSSADQIDQWMAAMNRPWRDIVFSQPKTMSSGMTPPDTMPT